MSDQGYDSRPATRNHQLRVQSLLTPIIGELRKRALHHDQSKMEPPELEIFDEYTPKLKATTYGSDEYRGYLEAMGDGLLHHYEHNRHHPEHFPDGINAMTLVDLLEMLADWKAATERHDDGSMSRSFAIQRERFGISDQLFEILTNTAVEYGWYTAIAEEPIPADYADSAK